MESQAQEISALKGSPIGQKLQVVALLDEAYACRINNLKRSKDLAKKALGLSRKLHDKALIGRSLNELALFSMIMGEYKSSMSMSKEAIKCFTQLRNERGIADAKYNIAGIYYKTDNYHLGLVYLIDCLTTCRKFNDYHNQARVLKSMGTIYEYFGDRKNAEKSYKNSISAAKKAHDLNLESNAYSPLSGIYLKKGKLEKAREIIDKAITIKQKTGDLRGLAFSIYGRGKVFVQIKKYRQAEKDFLEAIRIHDEMGERLGIGMAYYKLGNLYIETGRLKEARNILNKGLLFGEAYNMVIIKFKCNYLLYRICRIEKNNLRALEYLEKYLKQKEGVINAQTLKIIENYELISKMDTMEREAQLEKEKAVIIQKKNRAEQAARVKQEFLSTMSHEIRTPLNAVITIASLLEEKTDVEEKQLLDSMKFAANNLLMIINDILDFTKLDSGKVQLEARPCNILHLAGNIKNTYDNLAKEKGLNLLLSIGQEVLESYEMDETKISQVLGNLITNAIKFTERGSVEISIDRIHKHKSTDEIRFRISDTGIGIPERFQDEIFDSFSQPKSITTRKHGGTGLGLAIVKKLVEIHGSKVKVKSAEGEGSEFYFDLKLTPCETPHKVSEKPSKGLKHKTVLLAEDNMINAMVDIKLLSNWEMTTEHARNGKEAFEKSKHKIYDFILMDIHMPEMDGFEATRLIRKAGNPNVKTPIFALTADITAEHEEEYNFYFNGFLPKPIEINKLYDALTEKL